MHTRESFIGNDAEVNKKLKELKSWQESAIGLYIMKRYKRGRRKSRDEIFEVDPKQFEFPLHIKIEPHALTSEYF